MRIDASRANVQIAANVYLNMEFLRVYLKQESRLWQTSDWTEGVRERETGYSNYMVKTKDKYLLVKKKGLTHCT